MVGKLHIEKFQKHLSKSVWLTCTLNHCRTFLLFGETRAQRTFHATSNVSHIRNCFSSRIENVIHSFLFGLHAAHIPFFEVHMLQPTQGGLTQGSNGREWKTQIRVPPTPSLHPKLHSNKKCTSTWCVSRTWHCWFLWFCFFSTAFGNQNPKKTKYTSFKHQLQHIR